MAKKFTKLFLDDVVKTVGSKVFRKLSTEEPMNWQGTWLLNTNLQPHTEQMFIEIKGVYYITYRGSDTTGVFQRLNTNRIMLNNTSPTIFALGNSSYFTDTSPRAYTNYYYSSTSKIDAYDGYNTKKEVEQSSELGVLLRSIIITKTYEEMVEANGAEVVDMFLNYLSKNATKRNVNIIGLQIGGVYYVAEEGMTWAEWVDSQYNTGGYINNGSGITKGDNGYVNITETVVPPTEVIIANQNYSYSKVPL